jgi:transposase
MVDVAVADVRSFILWDIKPVREPGRTSAVPSNPNSRLVPEKDRFPSPLRQGWDKMAATAETDKQYVGVDVSKERLDVFLHPLGASFAVARSAAGIAELVRKLAQHAPALVAMEATGGLETLVTAGLVEAGLPVVVVNPKQIHNFAKALGVNAKTDTLDAGVIARFAAATKPEPRPLPDAQTQILSAFMTRRRQVTHMIAAEKNRALAAPLSKPLQKSIARIIAALERELGQLDKDIDGMIKASPVWRAKEELLTSVPGVGKIIARTLLCDMPELGCLDRKSVAALAGLAPWTRQSGKWRGRTMIGGGRAAPRTMLFIAAMVACRHNPDLKVFAIRLLNAGKAKMAVHIAVARKLLTILNAILRDGTPWQPKTP